MEPVARTVARNEKPSQVPERPDEHGPAPVRGWRRTQNHLRGPVSTSLNLIPGSRRGFLRAGVLSLGAFALWLMDSLARRADSIPETSERTVVLPWNAAQGVQFHERAIVVNGDDGVTVFSATCSHLGCRINRAEGRELVCPCHGSRFTLQGDVEHGPATRRLRALPFALDRARRVLRVTLGSSQT